MKENKLIIPKNHISFRSADDMNAICAPLFKYTDIDFLWYSRVYPDASMIVLNTNLDFHEYFFTYMLDKIISVDMATKLLENAPNSLQSTINRPYCLLRNLLPPKMMKIFSKRFHLNNGFVLTESFADYYEAFWFDSHVSEDLTNFYVSHFDALEKFIIYFREAADDLIKDNEKDKIIIPKNDEEYQKFLEKLAEEKLSDQEKLQMLHTNIELRKYPLHHKNKKIYLTAQELICLQHLAGSNSYKEIGNILNISHRTVETHLQNVKDKLGVSMKKQVLDIFCASKLPGVRVGLKKSPEDQVA